MWHYMGWTGLWFGWLILFVAFIVIVWAILRFAARQQTPKLYENPLDILKRRYAKGEINKIQFERIKKDLK